MRKNSIGMDYGKTAGALSALGSFRNNLMPRPTKKAIRDGYEWTLHPHKGWRRGPKAQDNQNVEGL